jgi:hypothetical protein
LRFSAFAAVLCVLPPALALPSFSRKYETSCITCHIVPPKLNAFGRAFRNLGYRMPGNDASLVRQTPVALGAPGWKQIWPKGIWPSDIPGGQYLGFTVTSNYNVDRDAKVSNEFDGIGEISLSLGGTLGESFSFFGDLGLYENGNAGQVGRMFVQYNHPSHYFNVTVGQFEPRAAPFSNDLRITQQTDYLFDTFPTVAAGNFFGFSPNQRGLELWGAKEGAHKTGGLLWSFGVVNGDFGAAADELRGSSIGGQIREMESARRENGGSFDVNSGKDVYLQASYKIGGLGVLGSGSARILHDTNGSRDDSVAVGGYYYRGTTSAFLERNGSLEFASSGNTFHRAGVSVDAWIKDLNIFGVWQQNRDRLDDGRVFEIAIPGVEVDYVTPWPWLVPAVRFEQVRPKSTQSFERWTASASFLVRANIVVTLDGTVSNRAPKLPLFDNRIRAGLRFYF